MVEYYFITLQLLLFDRKLNISMINQLERSYFIVSQITFDAEIFKVIDTLSFYKLHVLASGSPVRIAQMTLECYVIVLHGTAGETVLWE